MALSATNVPASASRQKAPMAPCRKLVGLTLREGWLVWGWLCLGSLCMKKASGKKEAGQSGVVKVTANTVSHGRHSASTMASM